MNGKGNGTIYKRGKRGYYYLQYFVNGIKKKVALRDQEGKPITTRRDAEFAALEITKLLIAKDKKSKLENIQKELKSTEDEIRDAEALEAARKKAEAERREAERNSIANGWLRFMECPSRPRSCMCRDEEIKRHTTAANYRAYYKRFAQWIAAAHPDKRLLSDVDRETAAAFMNEIRSDGAAGTFNKYLMFFNCLYDTLLKDEKLRTGNPFAKIQRTAPQYNSKKPLTVEQIAKLIDTAQGEMKLLFALGYFTGLRMGDCCTLLWREVDLMRGVIERIPRKTAHTVKDVQQSIVKIGIAPYLFEMLTAIPAAERLQYLLPKFAQKYLSGGDQQITKKILKHFAECGIETHRAGTGIKILTDPETGEPLLDKKTGKPRTIGSRAVVEIGFHSLRYSYISHNAEAGTPAAIIQRNAGHSNPAMTEHYTRISDRAAVKYAEVLTLPAAPAIGTTAAEPPAPGSIEADRAALRHLADELPPEAVKEILNHYGRR